MPQPLSETVSVRRCSSLLSLTSIVISDAPADMEFWAISRMLSDSSRMALSVQVFVENAVYLIGGESAVDIVVDRHDGGESARADAAAGFDGEARVVTALAGADAESLAYLVEDSLRAFDIAGGSETYGDVVSALGAQSELGVKVDTPYTFSSGTSIPSAIIACTSNGR